MLEFWLVCFVQILSSAPQLLTVYECSAIPQSAVEPVVRFLHLWKGCGDFRGHHQVLDPACHFFSLMCWLLLVPETQHKWRNSFASQCDMIVYCAKGEDGRGEQLIWGTGGRGWRGGQGLSISNTCL